MDYLKSCYNCDNAISLSLNDDIECAFDRYCKLDRHHVTALDIVEGRCCPAWEGDVEKWTRIINVLNGLGN